MDRYKHYDGADTNNFKHIPEISSYNHNYYIGLNTASFKKDLLYAKSDDDNETIWYVVEFDSYRQIGYSLCSENDKLNFYIETLT